MFPDKKKLVENISLSRYTVARRIDSLSGNIESTIAKRVSAFSSYSVALDESCDTADTAQLAVYIKGVDNDDYRGNGFTTKHEGDHNRTIKLRLWESQIRNQNPAHFPTLKNYDTSNLQYQKYGDKLAVLREEFLERFGDLKKHSQAIEVFASPFSVDVTAIPEDIQMEIIELQCNDELRKKFDDSSVYQFYKKHVSVTVYPKLSAHARKMMAVFGSTYVCEQLFSKMNLVKNQV